MEESHRLAELVQERIDDTVAAHRDALAPLGSDADAFLQEAVNFLTGGKRFRALFAALGYRAVRPLELTAPVGTELGSVLDAASALELFHAAALIHDDVIDRSATRRGRPATYRFFTDVHRQRGYRGDPEHFGISAAMLLGDLLQSWADELMQRACEQAASPTAAHAARAHFNRMRSEVAVGQFLDVLEEQRPAFAAHDEQLERSTRILVFKSAKYSVEAPLLIGAALAGAESAAEEALASFGLPVGVAFQLRDDLLGVFGDADVTGKPSGDDLIEGKRTVLVTFARENLPASQQRIFDDLLGTPLDANQISMLQSTIRQSGAVDRVESLIAKNVQRAHDALEDDAIRTEVTSQLMSLAARATSRVA